MHSLARRNFLDFDIIFTSAQYHGMRAYASESKRFEPDVTVLHGSMFTEAY